MPSRAAFFFGASRSTELHRSRIGTRVSIFRHYFKSSAQAGQFFDRHRCRLACARACLPPILQTRSLFLRCHATIFDTPPPGCRRDDDARAAAPHYSPPHRHHDSGPLLSLRHGLRRPRFRAASRYGRRRRISGASRRHAGQASRRLTIVRQMDGAACRCFSRILSHDFSISLLPSPRRDGPAIAEADDHEFSPAVEQGRAPRRCWPASAALVVPSPRVEPFCGFRRMPLSSPEMRRTPRADTTSPRRRRRQRLASSLLLVRCPAPASQHISPRIFGLPHYLRCFLPLFERCAKRRAGILVPDQPPRCPAEAH